jgi:hypothetical protein
MSIGPKDSYSTTIATRDEKGQSFPIAIPPYDPMAIKRGFRERLQKQTMYRKL